MIVLMTMDRIPYSAFSGDVGSQALLSRNSESLISRKAGTAVKTSVRKIPTRTRTARTPQVKKKALIPASLRWLSFFLRIAPSETLSLAHLKFLSLAALYLPSPTVKKPSLSTMACPSGPTIQPRNWATSLLGLPFVAM